LLITVLATIMVSVLISVGVSSKELTRRLGEYQDDTAEDLQNRLKTLEEEVIGMKLKQKEGEALVTNLREKIETKFLRQNTSIESIKSLVSGLSDKENALSEKFTADYERLNDGLNENKLFIGRVETKLTNFKVEDISSKEEIGDKIDTLGDELDKVKKSTKELNKKQTNQKVVNNLQRADLDRLQAMYSKISLTATTMAKLMPTDTIRNISDVLEEIQNSIADQFQSKIKLESLNITNLIDEKQISTLKSASDYSEEIKSLLLKFYSQFQAGIVRDLGYVTIPNTGQYHVSTEYKSWFDARKACEHKLGYLVEFQNKEQEDKVKEFVKDEFGVGRFWIGAFDQSKPSHGKATMSSIHGSYPGEKCLDRDEDTFCHNHGELGEQHPWILIEYPRPMNITKVVIKNRKSCCGDRFRDIEVRVSKEKPELSINQSFTGGWLLGRYPGPGWTDQPPVTFSDQGARGRWVVVQKNSPGVINIAEIYVSTDKTRDFVWDYSDRRLKEGYNNWNEGEPNNHNDEQECVESFGEGKGWNDQSCSEERRYVCQLDRENIPTLEKDAGIISTAAL